MTRPIKFRAKRISNGQWFYWELYLVAEEDPYILQELKEETTGQFTGLTDKNGKDVYEGDIVRCSKGCPHEVVWMQSVPSTNVSGMPGFYLKGLNEGYGWWYEGSLNKEEVIGNIHENPELLK